MSNLEDFILESKNELVALNTRIPRNLSAKVDLAVGILQTTHNVLTFSKQSAVQILLMRGFESLNDDFENGILGDSEHIATIRKSSIQNHSDSFELVPEGSEKKPTASIRNGYKEIANT